MSKPLGLKWHGAKLLKQDDAPRVITPQSLWEWLKSHNVEMSRRSITNALNDWQQVGIVERVAHGVFLNKQLVPVVRVDEAAPFLRQGAVVSLQRVLGDVGVLNNPSRWITCVLPTAAGLKGGLLETDHQTFHFSTIAPHLFPAPQDDWYDDAFSSNPHVVEATPEKALMDWLYLSSVSNGRARPAPPRHDIDLDLLDLERCDRLASKLNLTSVWNAWLSPAPSSIPKIK